MSSSEIYTIESSITRSFDGEHEIVEYHVMHGEEVLGTTTDWDEVWDIIRDHQLG